MNNDNKLRIALCQMAPVWLSKEPTLQKIESFINDAGKQQCDLIVFGEGLLPGYPFWVEHTNGAKFESDFQKEMYAHYLEQSVNIQGGDLESVCELASSNKIAIVLGVIERAMDRGGHSVYCSLVYITKEGKIANVHRKLMPTYEERLVWCTGDGHGLKTFPVKNFTMGALNCWENWMPLARTSLYGQGENLHIALWPGSVRNTEDLTRFIARESRSFVVSVSGLMNKENIPENIPFSKELKEKMPEVSADGGSCVAGPDGKWVLEPVVGKEGLFITDIDIKSVFKERNNFDPTGHYSRPDVLQLQLNSKRLGSIDEFNAV